MVLAAAALVACGSGSSSNSSGGTTPPAGGSGTSSNFYLVGPAGIDRGNGGTITFAGVPSSGTDLTLTTVTPATGAGSTLVQNGNWLGEAQVGQWTAASGSATAIGARFNVYAGTDNRFHVADLLIAAGAAAPTTAALSTLTPSAVCSSLPTVINDLATPANSLLVFDTPLSNSCGSLNDVYTVVPLSAGASTAPAAASNVEPVDAVRDATGAITQLLLLVHASAPNHPYVAVSAGTSLASPTTIGTLTGTGNNSGGASRDFQSLAVIPVGSSAVWLYRDGGAVYGVNLSTPTAPVQAFLDNDSDVVQGPAIVDGTMAYLALIDQTHPLPGSTPPVCCTNQIVRIDASALAAGEGVVLIEELSTGLQLLGIAGNNLFYEFSDGSALKSIDKTSSGTAASTPIVAFTGASPALYMDGPPPVVVSGGIYYTVSTPAPANPLQAWFYDGNASSLLGSFSQVLGGVTASPLATTNAGITASNITNLNVNVNPVAPTYASALVAIMPTTNTAPSIYPAASIFSYDSNGARSANLGTLYKPLADDYDTLAVAPGLLQAGVPALLEVSGYSASTSYTGHDLYQITPGTAGSLIQVTKNLQ